MVGAGSFIAVLTLLLSIIQSEGNQKVYDTYFNGFCYWSEEVTYHVYYSSGCKVYFTCQRGKFLDFHRCPESTVFNAETRECDPNAICRDRKRSNPTYDAWWERVVDVMDDVLEALSNSSTGGETATSSIIPVTPTQIPIDASTTLNKKERSSTSPDAITETAIGASSTVYETSTGPAQAEIDVSLDTADETTTSSTNPGTITRTAIDASKDTADETATSSTNPGTITETAIDVSKDTAYEIATSSTNPGTITRTAIDASNVVPSKLDISSELLTSEAASYPDLRQSVSTATNSVPENVESDFANPAQSVLPSFSDADLYHSKHTSMYLISMQFDTQASMMTYDLKSSATPFQEDTPETMDQVDLPSLDKISNSKSATPVQEEPPKTTDKFALPSLDTISNATKETNVMTDFVFPLVKDILKNETIMAKVNHLFDVLFETADPLLYQILDRKVDEEQGSTTTISLKELKEAWNRTSFAVRPYFRELVALVHPVFFDRVSKSGEIIMDYMGKNDAKIMHSIPSIFGSLFNMVFKYRLLDNSNLDQFTTFSLNEVRRDFKELSNILFRVFKDKA